MIQLIGLLGCVYLCFKGIEIFIISLSGNGGSALKGISLAIMIIAFIVSALFAYVILEPIVREAIIGPQPGLP